MSRRGSFSSVSASPILPQFNNLRRRSRGLAPSSSSFRSLSRPSSRSSSRGRRLSINDEYKRRSISADRAKTYDDMIVQASGTSKTTKIRRWDGNCRTHTNWDFLRKDPELWFPNGDTYVHFYSQGQSRRGPSLRLCLADIEAMNCRPLLEQTCSQPVPDTPPLPQRNRAAEGDYFPSRESSPRDPSVKYELFIPAPSGLSREDSMNYHLTTRNFFAWMFGESLVGARLGEALIGLRKRMDEWRPDQEENEDDFLAYIDDQGYTDFRDCPDHALAVLRWAETFEHSELWTDAFVHCVGMHEQLVTSREFSHVPRSTIAMVTRSNLEMAVRIERASVALAGFLEEDDILNSQIRLSDSALKHMQRFRSFLHSFYVQRYGYWPPHVVQAPGGGRIRPLPKHTFLTMYTDFRNLYEFLVDAFADPAEQSEAARSLVNVIGGLDRCHKFKPLPHALPQLPKIDLNPAEQRRQTSFFSMFGKKKARQAKRTLIATSLTSATNGSDIKVVTSAVVKAYASFEREYTLKENERISAAEARMARWTLIYALLQTLISVTTAPDEVQDVEGVDYPLCCQTAGTPPWKFTKPSSTSVAPSRVTTPKPSTTKSSPMTSSVKLSSTSVETVTPATTPGEPSLPSPLDLSSISERRAGVANDKKSLESPFPRSSALRPPVPPVPSTIKIPKLQKSAIAPTKSTKKSRIPVPVSSSGASTPSGAATPPPIRPYSKARTEAMRAKSIKSPQPRKPAVDTFLNTFDSDQFSSVTAANNEFPLPSPINTVFDSSSLAGSAPTLLSGHESDLDTPPPSSRSEHPDEFVRVPPSPSVYSAAISIVDSSDRELDSRHNVTEQITPYKPQRHHSKSLSQTPTHNPHPSTSSSQLSNRSGVDSVIGYIPYPPGLTRSNSQIGDREKAFSSQRATMPSTPGSKQISTSATSNFDFASNATNSNPKSRRPSKSSAFSLRALNAKAARSTTSVNSVGLGQQSREGPATPGLRPRAYSNTGSVTGSVRNLNAVVSSADGVEEYGGGKPKSRHVRDRSSELAKSFRNEIRWKEGPGWDREAEGMLKGNEGVLGKA